MQSFAAFGPNPTVQDYVHYLCETCPKHQETVLEEVINLISVARKAIKTFLDQNFSKLSSHWKRITQQSTELCDAMIGHLSTQWDLPSSVVQLVLKRSCSEQDLSL
eukprot:gb/GECG01013037.1/.p1 GENE.gb/GECG01013037.1/~~gb/GECG01013037.1/.p1  ORF type:complete len:106 (+),score=6.65 gb/GECG01013037.1/:1-318(+)